MNKSKKLSKKPNMVLVVIAVIAACVALGLGVFWLYNTNNANKNELGFEAYAPTMLPAGVELKDLTLYRKTGKPEITVRFDVDKNNPQFFITEHKSTSKELANGNQPDCGQSDICTPLTSPKGQVYYIRTSVDDGHQAYNKTISWLKGQTSFSIVSYLKSITEDEAFWGKMIDEFKPADYSGQPVQVITPSGV